MPIPSKANYVKVYVNDDYRGLYTNTEHIGNEFLDYHFGDSQRPFIKCDPIFIDIPPAPNSNLAYYPDTMEYATLYDMKSDYGLEELQELTFQLNFFPESIEDYLDVDRTLWFHALSNIFVHFDGYMAFAHNYYLYKDKNGRWNPILWDVNGAFGRLLWNGNNAWPLNFSQLKKTNPLHHINRNEFRPLIANLLQQPRFYKMYQAHYKTIKEEMIDNGYYFERAQFWHDLADTIIVYEPYPLSSYNKFLNNLTSNVGFLFDLSPGIQSLMEGRKDYLDTLGFMNLSQPLIADWSVSNTSPEAFETINFNLTTNDAETVILGYRYGIFDRFEKVQMFDDGAHGDGGAGDGVYGVSVVVDPGEIQYYFYAENEEAGVFSPARAEYEFYALSIPSPLVINELQPINQTTQVDQDQEYDDWIELYNNADQFVNLNGHFLSDDEGDLLKWAFPDTSIGPLDYLIVWADDQPEQSGLHTNFRLSSLGETLYFSTPSGVILDEVTFPSVQLDFSYARIPNGTGPWTVTFPTFSTSNDNPLDIEDAVLSAPSLFPTPSTGLVSIEMPEHGEHILIVRSIEGREILAERFVGRTFVEDFSDLSPGIYLFTIDGHTLKAIIE